MLDLLEAIMHGLHTVEPASGKRRQVQVSNTAGRSSSSGWPVHVVVAPDGDI
jgi:hypothetical protein